MLFASGSHEALEGSSEQAVWFVAACLSQSCVLHSLAVISTDGHLFGGVLFIASAGPAVPATGVAVAIQMARNLAHNFICLIFRRDDDNRHRNKLRTL